MKKKYLSLILISLVGAVVASYSACSPSRSFKEVEMPSTASLSTPIADSSNPTNGAPITNPNETSQPLPTPAPMPPAPLPAPMPPAPAPAPAPTPDAPPVNSKTWTNEPAGSLLLADCPMDTPDCNGNLIYYYSMGAVTQLSDGATAYFSQLPRNQSYGTGGVMTYYKSGAGIPELFVGLRWKNNSEFQGDGSGINTLFYMRNVENPAGAPSVSGNFILRGPQYGPWKLEFRPNINQGSFCGDGGWICAGNANSISIERDKWYHIETYVRASSCMTCNNAVVRWWVNGKLVGNYTNLNYGGGVVNEFVFSPNWDGTAPYQCTNRDCSKEWTHYIDHLHISAPSCGAGGCVLTGL